LAPVNIGDFDSAWENYEHNGGPALIDEAKVAVKAGDLRPNWRIKIGTEDMTRRLIDAEVTFNATGESGMTFRVATQLHKQGYERARVQLWIGYGNKLVPFFRGKLADPKDSPSGLFSEAAAYGLSTQLGARHFGGRVSYQGWDLRDAFWDIVERFGADQDRFFFDGEHSQIIEGEEGEETATSGVAEFGLEHTMLEAMQAILPQMGFAGFDQAGGMFVVRKPPRADEVTRSSLVGILDDGHYPQGGFTYDQSTRNMYSKVIVFRRNEDFAAGGEPGVATDEGMTTDEDGGAVPAAFEGSEAENKATKTWRAGRSKASEYAVYAEHDVDNSGPFNVHEGRAYIIPDWAGSQEHAEREAEWWADSFSAGVGRYQLTDISPIDFSLYDDFGLERREERRTPEGHASFGQLYWTSRGDIYDVLYACQVESMTLRIAQQTFRMSLEGPAVVKEETLVQAATNVEPIELSIPQDPTPPAVQRSTVRTGIAEVDSVVTDAGDTVIVEDN
jgi:hypothetical protein